MPRSYTSREGKEVVYISGSKKLSGIVTGCDKDLGITIQEKGTKRYLYCLNGPSSIVDKERKERGLYKKGDTTKLRKRIREIVSQIDSGTVSPHKNLLRGIAGIASVKTCAFSQ